MAVLESKSDEKRASGHMKARSQLRSDRRSARECDAPNNALMTVEAHPNEETDVTEQRNVGKEMEKRGDEYLRVQRSRKTGNSRGQTSFWRPSTSKHEEIRMKEAKPDSPMHTTRQDNGVCVSDPELGTGDNLGFRKLVDRLAQAITMTVCFILWAAVAASFLFPYGIGNDMSKVLRLWGGMYILVRISLRLPPDPCEAMVRRWDLGLLARPYSRVFRQTNRESTERFTSDGSDRWGFHGTYSRNTGSQIDEPAIAPSLCLHDRVCALYSILRSVNAALQSWVTSITSLIWRPRELSNCKNAFLWSWSDILIVGAPIDLVLEFAGINKLAVFVISFVAVIPLAARFSYATEELTLYIGEMLGSSLNAAFGHAAELIVRVIALQKKRVHRLCRLVRPPGAHTVTLILCTLMGQAAANDLPRSDEYLGVDRNFLSDAIAYFWDLTGSAAVTATFLVGSIILFIIIFCVGPRKGPPRKTAFVAAMAAVSWWLMEIIDRDDHSQKRVVGWMSALLWAILLTLCAKGLDDSDVFLSETLCFGGLMVMGMVFLIVAVKILEGELLDHNALRMTLSFGLPPLNGWTWFQFRRHWSQEIARKTREIPTRRIPDHGSGTTTAVDSHIGHLRGHQLRAADATGPNPLTIQIGDAARDYSDPDTV